MIEVLDVGITSYSDSLALQNKLWAEVEKGDRKPALILCEHPHVYTFGKSADHNNLLIQEDFLARIGAEVFQTDRGGDITYHGPGQLVGYPILNLRAMGLGVKAYVQLLEDSLIASLGQLGIRAYQIHGLVGIWVGEEHEVKRKIGAIGIRVKNGISMHGFALNVNTDLSYFNHIVPCGISDKSVTSIQKELAVNQWDKFKELFIQNFVSNLQLSTI